MTTDHMAQGADPIQLVMSETPVIIRQLHSPGFRRLDLRIRTGASGQEIVDLANETKPDAVIMPARLSDNDAFSVLEQLRAKHPDLPAVIVSLHGVFHDLTAEKRSNDEILSCPLPRGELYKVLASFLALPSRPNLVAHVTLGAPDEGSRRTLTGELTHLAVSGARMILPEQLEERMKLTLELHCSAGTAKLPGRVIWSRSRSLRSEELRQRRGRRAMETGGAQVSVQFLDISDETREFLRKVTSWDTFVDEATGAQRILLLRGLTEMSDLSGLAEQLNERVDIDLSMVNVVYSVGITRWIKFLRQIPESVHYRFVNCSTAFCLEASAFEDIFGRGEVASVFAPYCCTSCAYEAERLIRTEIFEPNRYPPELPMFTCPWCRGPMHFDDLPERYFGYLRPNK